jgi:hypothetical protein
VIAKMPNKVCAERCGFFWLISNFLTLGFYYFNAEAHPVLRTPVTQAGENLKRLIMFTPKNFVIFYTV